MTTLYLSGPMSGIPQFNFPAFEAAAKVLRAAGFTIISPNEMDSDAVRAAAALSVDGDPSALPPGETWGTMLGRDVAIIADQCDGIVLLRGWEKSRGARLEAVTGLLTDKNFYLYDTKYYGDGPIDVSRNFVIDRVRF